MTPTSTLPSSAVASSMNALRSSAVNSVFSLRTGLLTTPTTTLSNTLDGPGDHVEVPVGDRVVAARADRDAWVLFTHGVPWIRIRCRRRSRSVSRGSSTGSGWSGEVSTITRPPSASTAGMSGTRSAATRAASL